MSGVSVYHVNYLFPNDLWLFLHPHYKDFAGHATTITTIKIGYDFPIKRVNGVYILSARSFPRSNISIYASLT